MAKQTSLYTFKGSVGNVSGYKVNTAANGKSKLSVRIKPSKVSDPKTRKQAAQRSKVKPALLFYQAFESILNHAFFPNGKAVKNKNRFLKLALENEVPNVAKDEVKLPVVPYIVSEGNLGLDHMTIMSKVGTILNFNIKWDVDLDDSAITIGNLSTVLLQNNPLLKEGFELTFITLYEKGNNIKQKVGSFVLDTTNTITTVGDCGFGDIEGNIMVMEGSRAAASINIYTGDSVENNILAAALIISAKSGSTWRYTNSRMYLSAAGEALLTPAIQSAVIDSYMGAAATATSDLILQQADNQEDTFTPYIESQDVELASGITGTVDAPAAIAVLNAYGTRAVVVNNGGAVCAYLSAEPHVSQTPCMVTIDNVEDDLMLSQTAWANSETITVTEILQLINA